MQASASRAHQCGWCETSQCLRRHGRSCPMPGPARDRPAPLLRGRIGTFAHTAFDRRRWLPGLRQRDSSAVRHILYLHRLLRQERRGHHGRSQESGKLKSQPNNRIVSRSGLLAITVVFPSDCSRYCFYQRYRQRPGKGKSSPEGAPWWSTGGPCTHLGSSPEWDWPSCGGSRRKRAGKDVILTNRLAAYLRSRRRTMKWPSARL